MEQEKDTFLYKETFFDRIFRPQVITLETGTPSAAAGAGHR